MKILLTLLTLLSATVLAQDPGPHPVIKAVDGDTLRLNMNGTPQTVRLIGVDTPETVHPFVGVEPYGPEASAFTKSLVTGEEVVLEFDVGRRDRYGRLLVYAILPDGREVNLLLAQSGLASALTVPPNVAQAEIYHAAVAGARSVGKGMWATHPSAWPFVDRNCASFASRKLAEAFHGGAEPGDPHRLDGDNDARPDFLKKILRSAYETVRRTPFTLKCWCGHNKAVYCKGVTTWHPQTRLANGRRR